MTHIIETTVPITLLAADTEAARCFRVWLDAEARLDGPEGCEDEADAALDAVLAAPVETLADLAALVVASATANAPSPDSPLGKLERAARSILAARARAYAVTDTRPDTKARRLYHAWVAAEDRANDQGDSDALEEANHLAMRLVRAPITCTADVALMAHALIVHGDPYEERWNALRMNLARFV